MLLRLHVFEGQTRYRQSTGQGRLRLGATPQELSIPHGGILGIVGYFSHIFLLFMIVWIPLLVV